MDFRDISEFLKDTFKYILVVVGVFLVVMFVVTFQQVIGPSMEPTFNEGDVLLLDKLSYRFFKPSRNDIVVIEEDSKNMIKRIIGLPGETISYKDNILYIDGESYKETNITVETADFEAVTLGSDEYFVMGDNRINSSDSREFGAVDRKHIVGRVALRIWPFNKFGIVH